MLLAEAQQQSKNYPPRTFSTPIVSNESVWSNMNTICTRQVADVLGLQYRFSEMDNLLSGLSWMDWKVIGLWDTEFDRGVVNAYTPSQKPKLRSD